MDFNDDPEKKIILSIKNIQAEMPGGESPSGHSGWRRKKTGRHVPECVCADAHIEETRTGRPNLMDGDYKLFPNNVKREK